MKKRFKKQLFFAVSTIIVAAMLWPFFRTNFMRDSQLSRQRKLLKNARIITLYSLEDTTAQPLATGDPKLDRMIPKPRVYQETFHDYGVLGKTQIVDDKTKTELLNALYRGLEKDGSIYAMCFSPRHGIRVQDGMQKLDLVICFECEKIKVSTNLSGATIHTSAVPQNAFDAILKSAKIPLAKRLYSG